jgi:hypothetical protein
MSKSELTPTKFEGKYDTPYLTLTLDYNISLCWGIFGPHPMAMIVSCSNHDLLSYYYQAFGQEMFTSTSYRKTTQLINMQYK